MSKEKLEEIKERLWSTWDSIVKKSADEDLEYPWRSRIVVFIVSLILALALWSMVNLSRDYNLNINMPISLGNIPNDRALAEELPDFATVSVSGEGWQLINIYNNPPRIFVDVTQEEINLYDQVQQQMNATPELSIQKVQPLFLNIELEEKVSKKVPIIPHVSVSFRGQFDFLGNPTVDPDSIRISGASSLLDNVNEWHTDTVSLGGISEDIQTPVPLKKPEELLSLSREEVTYKAEVAQYTEGETRIFVEARNMPRGRTVTFSPSFITVKYNVPINEYAEVKDLVNPFRAYVDYRQIQRDSTGFVIPQIEKTTDSRYHIQLRSFQPTEVSYFMVIGN